MLKQTIWPNEFEPCVNHGYEAGSDKTSNPLIRQESLALASFRVPLKLVETLVGVAAIYGKHAT
jgi:hypothetical protein